MIDPDCPCCQMLADMPGPMFWHLDGSKMDDDFAFDFSHRTREEWDAEQRRWEEHRQRFEAERAERQLLGVTDPAWGVPDKDSVWTSSFSVADAADVPLGIRLFGIGAHLAELIADLRRDAAGSITAAPLSRQFSDALHRDFCNLREILQNSEPTVAEALIHGVIDRFADSLASIAAAHPDLTRKCESLTSSVTKFLDP